MSDKVLVPKRLTHEQVQNVERGILSVGVNCGPSMIRAIYSAALREVEAAPEPVSAEPAQQWIKCSERMPDLIGSCLALSGNTIYFAFYNSDGKWAHENSFLTSVTHWMPLPAPPAEG